jgi:hypothetical protein
MPAIINSAPDCVTHVEGAKPADDIADFILQANYQDCAGFMTFGPGSTYGDGGTGAAGSYMVLTWVGIVFMVAVLVAWVAFENRRVLAYAAANALGRTPDDRLPPQDEPPPQPGLTR